MKFSRLACLWVFLSSAPPIFAIPLWAPLERNEVHSVCHGKGRYVAVGRYGNTVWSTDGHRWWGGKSAISGSYEHVYAVCFGNDEFFAVGRFGKMMRSADGKEWAAVASPTGTDLFDVTYADGRYMAVGENAVIYSSPDGQTWSGPLFSDSGPYPPVSGLSCVKYGNGAWVAIEDGNTRGARSTDGISWSRMHVGMGYATEMIFEGGKFVVVGSAGSQSNVGRSADGATWQISPAPEPLQDIAFQNGVYVALADSGKLYRSADLQAWTQTGAASGLNDLTAGNGSFVALGRNYTATSPDGTNWTIRGKVHPNDPEAAIWFKDSFVVTGGDGYVGRYDWRTETSSTGTPLSSDSFRCLATDGESCVAVGNNGILIRTVDGEDWENVTPPPPLDDPDWTPTIMYNVKHVLGSFVATGSDDTIQVSPDGEHWTTTYQEDKRTSWYSLASNGSKALLVGTNRVSSSTNLSTWTTLPTPPATFFDIAYGNGVFVAVGNGIYATADGVTWTPGALPGGPYVQKITFANGRFVVATEYTSRIFTSANGVEWTEEPTGVEEAGYFGPPAYGDGIFVAVGRFGQVLMSSRAAGAQATNETTLSVDPQKRLSLSIGTGDSAGRLYQIEHSQDLLEWQLIANEVTPDIEGVLYRTEVPEVQPKGFFRVAPVSGP